MQKNFGVKKNTKLPRASWVGHRRSIGCSLPTYIQRNVYNDAIYSDDTDDEDTDFSVLTLRTCNNLSDHGYYQSCNIITEGVATIKSHDHPQGLTQLTFANCVVKVRTGHDLDKLIAMSNEGPVYLFNVQTKGWIVSDAILLPAFILLRWMSSMRQ
jgi:hypothetical protein